MGKSYVAMIISLSLAKISAFRVMVWMYDKLYYSGTSDIKCHVVVALEIASHAFI